MGVKEYKTSKQKFTEINEFCMTKKDLLTQHKSQQKLVEITPKFSWKVNEFQWTQLLTQILSFISTLAKQNQKQNLIQRQRKPEFQGIQDWRKLCKWCIDGGTTVPSHCAMYDSSSPILEFICLCLQDERSATMVPGIPLHYSRTIEDNCWSQMEEIMYSWSAKWEIN